MQEVPQQLLPGFAGNGLGVELDPLDQVLRVAKAHDLSVVAPGGHGELRGQGGLIHRKGVVPREGRRCSNGAKEAVPIQVNLFRLSVDNPLCRNDARAVGGGNGLVPQADPQDGRGGPVAADNLDGDAGVLRAARSRRDDDPRRIQGAHLLRRDRIVPDDSDFLLRELLQVLIEVVRKGIVVIDQENHGYTSTPIAAARAASLAWVSSNSFSGTES